LAFYNCSKLTSITNHNPVPVSIFATVFEGVNKNACVLKVAVNAVALYKKVDVWKEFMVISMKNQIAGTVKRPDLTPLTTGQVSLLKIQSGGRYILIETISVENDGTYLFSEVEDGNYVIRAKAEASENTFPTYYGNSEFWSMSTTVIMADNVSVSSIDITLIPRNDLEKGTSFISGYVGEDDGTKAVKPAEGVDVYIQKTESADIWQTVAKTTTNATGDFEFGDMPEGTYRIILEVPGLIIPPSANLNITEGDTIRDIEFIIPKDDSRIFSFTKKEQKIKVYPNPTTGELKIKNYELKITNVEIFNIMGKSVGVEKFRPLQNAEISINISHLPSGTYFGQNIHPRRRSN